MIKFYCQNCKSQVSLAKDSKFCPKCGQPTLIVKSNSTIKKKLKELQKISSKFLKNQPKGLKKWLKIVTRKIEN